MQKEARISPFFVRKIFDNCLKSAKNIWKFLKMHNIKTELTIIIKDEIMTTKLNTKF